MPNVPLNTHATCTCQTCLRCCRDALATARGWDPPRTS
jgi:hypothetical protein